MQTARAALGRGADLARLCMVRRQGRIRAHRELSRAVFGPREVRRAASIVAMHPLALLMALLRFERQRRDRARHQP